MRKSKKSHYALLELSAGSRTSRAAVRVEPKLPTSSGWIALPAPVTVGTGGGKHIELSYRVIRCPQFVPDERIKRCPQAQRHGCIEGATRLCDSCRYYTIKNKGNY